VKDGAVAASDEISYSGTTWGNSLLPKVRRMVTTTMITMDAPFFFCSCDWVRR